VTQADSGRSAARALLAGIGGAVALFSSAMGAPVGEWQFDDPAHPLRAALGQDLTLAGTATAVTGTTPSDGAVRVGVGSFLRCAHGIAPNGGGASVNEYSVVWDFCYPDSSAGHWISLLQTNEANTNDTDLCIRSPDRAVGIGAVGYSSTTTAPATWYRLALSVKNGSWFRLYLNGALLLNGTVQPVDGRHALSPHVLFAADDNGEDFPLDFTRIAVYDYALTANEVAALGVPYAANDANHAPEVLSAPAGPDTVATGSATDFAVRGSDADGDSIQTRINWGDGQVSDWSAFSATSALFTASHTYRSPTSCMLRAVARDGFGATSAWTTVQALTVTGEVVVSLVTPAYLQNMTPTGMVVMCESGEDVPLRVDYGATDAYGASASTVRQASGSGTSWFHRALLSGLAPGAGYHCRLFTAGGKPVGEDLAFQTAATGRVDFSFGVWGDSQGNNGGAWTADPLEPTVSMMKHMVASGAAFGLTSGDLAEDGSSYGYVRSFYLDRVARHLGSSVPWYVAWGNHDASATNAVIRRASDLPSRHREGLSSGHGSYAFTYGGCFFVCLDYAYQPEIANGWLEQTLGSPDAQRARFRFVVNHVPPYCERWINGDGALRDKLVPLLERYRVAVCFSGHTHEYERGATNGVYYVISGGGSWLDFAEPIVKDWPHMTVGGAQNVPGSWAKESSQGVLGAPLPISGGLFNEYVLASVRGTTLSLQCRAFNADGSYIGALDAVDLSAPAAAMRIWSGSGADGAWNTAGNWEGGVAPAEGSDLLFAGSQRLSCSNAALASVGSIIVSAPGFALTGKALSLNGNLACAAASGQTAWRIPVALGNACRVSAAGGSLLLDGAIDNNGHLLTVEGSGSTVVSAPLCGSGGLTKTGGGMLTLTGTNTYGGGTALNGGTLSISSGSALGSGPLAINLASGGTFLTVSNAAAVALPNAIALPAPATAQTYTLLKHAAGTGAGTPLDLAGTISGGNATATLFLNSNTSGDTTTTYRFSAANTFRATINLNRGGVVVAHPQGLGSPDNLVSLNGNGNATLGDLRFDVSATLPNPVQLVNAPSPINTGTNRVALSGAVSGPGKNLVKLGSGTLELLGTNTYTGATAVNAGTLKLGRDGSLASPAVTLASGAVLDVTAQATYGMSADHLYTFDVSADGAGSAGRIDAAGLDVSEARVALNVTGTLDDPVYVLAECASLTGSRFASVAGSPKGYALVYGRTAAGKVHITLVRRPGTQLIVQ